LNSRRNLIFTTLSFSFPDGGGGEENGAVIGNGQGFQNRVVRLANVTIMVGFLISGGTNPQKLGSAESEYFAILAHQIRITILKKIKKVAVLLTKICD
jgi:hypothetical protein